MINPPVRALLDAIGKVEAGARSYNAIYLPAERKLGRQNLTAMTVAEVRTLQNRMVKVSASSACGRYQFIRKTLAGLIAEMTIPGSARFDEMLQDRLAMRLLERRGLSKFLAGKLSREAFATNLAHEWASLPCIGGSNHGKPSPEAMRKSCYAGDGLNHALMTPKRFLALIDALRAPEKPADGPKPSPPIPAPRPVDPAPEPETVPAKPKLTKWQAFWLSVTGAAGTFAAWIAENAELIMGCLAVIVLVAIGVVIWRKRRG